MACNKAPNPPPPPYYGTQQQPFSISGTTALANLPWVVVLNTSQPLGPVRKPIPSNRIIGMTAWVQFQLPPPYPQAVGPTVSNPLSPGPQNPLHPNDPAFFHPDGTQFSIGLDGLPFLFSNQSNCVLPFGGNGENPILEDPTGTNPAVSDALSYTVLEWSSGFKPNPKLKGIFGAKIFVKFPNFLGNSIFSKQGGTLICGCGSGCPPP